MDDLQRTPKPTLYLDTNGSPSSRKRIENREELEALSVFDENERLRLEIEQLKLDHLNEKKKLIEQINILQSQLSNDNSPTKNPVNPQNDSFQISSEQYQKLEVELEYQKKYSDDLNIQLIHTKELLNHAYNLLDVKEHLIEQQMIHIRHLSSNMQKNSYSPIKSEDKNLNYNDNISQPFNPNTPQNNNSNLKYPIKSPPHFDDNSTEIIDFSPQYYSKHNSLNSKINTPNFNYPDQNNSFSNQNSDLIHHNNMNSFIDQNQNDMTNSPNKKSYGINQTYNNIDQNSNSFNENIRKNYFLPSNSPSQQIKNNSKTPRAFIDHIEFNETDNLDAMVLETKNLTKEQMESILMAFEEEKKKLTWICDHSLPEKPSQQEKKNKQFADVRLYVVNKSIGKLKVALKQIPN